MKNPHGIPLPPQAFNTWTITDEYPKSGLAHVYLKEGAMGVEREIAYSSEDDVRVFLNWIGQWGRLDAAQSCFHLLDFKRFDSLSFRVAAFFNHSKLCHYLLPYSDVSALRYRVISSFLLHGEEGLIKQIHENHNIPWSDFELNLKYLIEEKNLKGIQALLPYLKRYVIDGHNVLYDVLLLTPSAEHDELIDLMVNNPHLTEQQKWARGDKDHFSALTHWICYNNWWACQLQMDTHDYGGFDKKLKDRIDFIVQHCPVSTNSFEVFKYVIRKRYTTELDTLISYLDQPIDVVESICASMNEEDETFTLNAIKWQQSMRELTLKEIDELLCASISEKFSSVTDYLLPLAHNQCRMTFSTALKHNVELFLHFAERFNLHPRVAYSGVYGFDMEDVVESPYNIDLTKYFFTKMNRDDKNFLVLEACKQEKHDLILYINENHSNDISFAGGLLTLLASNNDNSEVVKEVFNKNKHLIPSWEEALRIACGSRDTKKVDLVLGFYREDKTEVPMSVFLHALNEGGKDITRILWPYHNKEHFNLILNNIRRDAGEEIFEFVMEIYKELQTEEDKKILKEELGVGSEGYLRKSEGKVRLM